MNKFGGWVVKVSTSSYPQKVASVIDNLNELIGFGCKYDVVAYLGYQEVNGINHAILAQQTILNGEDSKDVVVIVLNEKPNSMDVSLGAIYKVVESGGALGGTKINLTTKIPDEALDAFKIATTYFVGSKIDLVAYVGSQIAKGTNHIFIGTITPVTPNGKPEVVVITVNTMVKTMKFERVLDIGKNDVNLKDSVIGTDSLGYAFTW